jgi:hypothetical protein
MKKRSRFVNSIIVGSIVLLGALLARVPQGLGAATAQTQQLAFSIDSGGSATGSFSADQYFSGGSTFSTSVTIDMSQITSNPHPAAVFQTERYGAFSYTIPNLTPVSAQTVTLYFAEIYFSSAGQRVFNVSINGTTVLSNFDVYAAAGGKDRAIARTFNTTANSSGQVVIQFTSVTENPKVSGLTVRSSAGGNTPSLVAFPGAEGWGAVTAGGRGGAVYHVTNLNDSGPGSFRAACEASGPRTVVFDVSGIIRLTSEISVRNPFLTIAGQTAPGQGVIVAGETLSLDTHDIIIRYMRFRRGETNYERRDDSLGSDSTKGNIIIDHVSASWGLDENMSVYRYKLDQPIVPGGSTVLPARNITIQWSISSEALNPFNHAFGSTLGGAGVNFHHNLWACNTARNPSISFSHFMDFRNNVLFNWEHRSIDGAGEEAHVNIVNNYYRPGPATESSQVRYRIVKPEIRSGVAGYGKAGWWYVNGNHVVGNSAVTADNWNGGVQFDLPMETDWARMLTSHTHVEFPDDPDDPNDDVNGVVIPIPDLPRVATQSAVDAYQTVLARAGATLPERDSVDVRVMNMVSSGIATGGPAGNGIINHPNDVGGYPAIPVVTRPANWDTDQDGMPDSWETAHGLNPSSAADCNGDFDNDGYTNLEEYLNELGAFKAVRGVVWDGELNNRYARIENWDIAFQPSRFDTAVIRNATVVVDAIGQHAGILRLTNNATLNITNGWLNVADQVKVSASCSLAVQSAGSLRVTNDIVNNGTMRLTGSARLTVGGRFTNNGVLDISNWRGTLPENFVNNGTVITDPADAPATPTGLNATAGNAQVSLSWKCPTCLFSMSGQDSPPPTGFAGSLGAQ